MREGRKEESKEGREGGRKRGRRDIKDGVGSTFLKVLCTSQGNMWILVILSSLLLHFSLCLNPFVHH